MLCQSKKEIKKFHTESTEIFKDNMTECYMDRHRKI